MKAYAVVCCFCSCAQLTTNRYFKLLHFSHFHFILHNRGSALATCHQFVFACWTCERPRFIFFANLIPLKNPFSIRSDCTDYINLSLFNVCVCTKKKIGNLLYHEFIIYLTFVVDLNIEDGILAREGSRRNLKK